MTDNYAALTAWSAANLETVIFYLTVVLAMPLAFGVLLDKRIIRSGFLLIGVFGCISVMFLLLQAQFLALAQIMIYAVGISLVIVIALMLTNPKLEQEISPAISAHKPLGIVVAILMFGTIYMAVRDSQWITAAAPMQGDNVVRIGSGLLRYYSLPFEFASILLLVALVGAVMLAKSEKATKPEQWIEDSSESAATEV